MPQDWDAGRLGKGGSVLPGRGWLIAIYAALSVIILAPIMSVQVPCLGDYLNHLARISIMGKLGSSAALDAFYERRWKLVPYYGMDLPVLALSRVLGIYAAGRVFVALCVLMPVAAVMVLRRVVVGRVGLVPVLAYLFCYSYVLQRGLLPYLATAGLAIALFAAWIATAEWPRWPRACAFAAAALGLYLGHAFAFAVYCILVAGFEIGWACRYGFRLRGEVVWRWLAAGAQALPMLLACAVLGGNDNVSAAAFTRFGGAADKISAILSPVYFPGAFSTSAILAFLLACVLVFGWRMRLAPALRGPAIAVAVVATITPRVLFNIWGADLRLPLVLVIVLLAGVVPRAEVARRRASMVLAACVALVLLRASEAWAMLRALDWQVASVREAVATLPVGARLLVVELASPNAGRVAPVAMTEHIGMVAAIDRDAFIPFLFIGNTPVVPRVALRDSSSSDSSAIDLAQLWDGYRRSDPASGPPGFGWGGRMYWLGWPEKFDYVLVEHFSAAATAAALPGNLQVMRRGVVADLFVVKAAGAMAGSNHLP